MPLHTHLFAAVKLFDNLESDPFSDFEPVHARQFVFLLPDETVDGDGNYGF